MQPQAAPDRCVSCIHKGQLESRRTCFAKASLPVPCAPSGRSGSLVTPVRSCASLESIPLRRAAAVVLKPSCPQQPAEGLPGSSTPVRHVVEVFEERLVCVRQDPRVFGRRQDWLLRHELLVEVTHVLRRRLRRWLDGDKIKRKKITV